MKLSPLVSSLNNNLESMTVVFAKVTAVEVLQVRTNICVTNQPEPWN